MIHGGGDDDAAWPTVGRANFILDNLIAAGKAKPMVIVFPNGSINGNLQRVSSSEKDPFIPELLTVIIPYIEANYRVSKSPEDRALAGLSMGGGQTAFIGLTHAQEFRYLGIFSSGLPDQKKFEKKYGPTLVREAARLKLIWFGYGTRDPAKPNAETTVHSGRGPPWAGRRGQAMPRCGESLLNDRIGILTGIAERQRGGGDGAAQCVMPLAGMISVVDQVILAAVFEDERPLVDRVVEEIPGAAAWPRAAGGARR